MYIEQLCRFIGITGLKRPEGQSLSNDRSSTGAGIELLDQILTGNARGWNLNSSAVNDWHEYILLLYHEGAMNCAPTSSLVDGRLTNPGHLWYQMQEHFSPCHWRR